MCRGNVRWLSEQTGKRYRLPSEAEWEYSARSSGKDEFWAGTSDESKLSEYAVFGTTKGTEPVGTKKPNGLGLYDMSGNVWEWVEDCWHGDYNGAPTDGRPWKVENGGECGRRVIRGGSWDDRPGDLRSSFRDGDGARRQERQHRFPSRPGPELILCPFTYYGGEAADEFLKIDMAANVPQAVQSCHELLLWLILQRSISCRLRDGSRWASWANRHIGAFGGS
jgi:Sulfatase-modifying factor enzyme 1